MVGAVNIINKSTNKLKLKPRESQEELEPSLGAREEGQSTQREQPARALKAHRLGLSESPKKAGLPECSCQRSGRR